MSLKDVSAFFSKNAPTILTIAAAVGAVTTVVLAIRATPRAQDHIYDKEDEEQRDLTTKEVVQACWKDYIPTAVMGGMTLACIFGARYCSNKQKEALAGSYILAHMALQEYERVVEDHLGEKKAREFRDEARVRVADIQSPPANFVNSNKSDAIQTGHGQSLFYDVPEQQYFYSDIHFLKNSKNDLNDRLLAGHEPYIDQNEIRAEWGLPMKRYGSEMVITPEHLLQIHIEPEMMDNGEVRLNLDYELYPKSEVLYR